MMENHGPTLAAGGLARTLPLLHDVNRATGFASAFTNLRTGEGCDDDSALLAAVLADATNLGLGRMAAASQGVSRDKLIWTAPQVRQLTKAGCKKVFREVASGAKTDRQLRKVARTNERAICVA
jgi:hypothetical protein